MEGLVREREEEEEEEDKGLFLTRSNSANWIMRIYLVLSLSKLPFSILCILRRRSGEWVAAGRKVPFEEEEEEEEEVIRTLEKGEG